MESKFIAFSDEALRIAANLEQRHDAWIEAVRRVDALPSSMFWVTKGEREYLAIKRLPGDPGTTAGARDASTEARFDAFQRERADARSVLENTQTALVGAIRQYRALRLPLAMPVPARLLRELDLAGLLGADIMLVGTNAFTAYELQAGARFPRGVEETDDFDVAWCRGSAVSLSAIGEKATGAPLMRVLRSVDPQFRINPRKPYQALSSDGYEVELLVAPSLFKTLSDDEPFRPLAAFPEQEWLLRGTPVRQVIAARDNKTCPIFAPDPRWMALHKLWLSEKPERDSKKKPKDRIQGDVLLDAVRDRMAFSHPLSLDFVVDLPEELLPHFNRWAKERGFVPENTTAPGLR